LFIIGYFLEDIAQERFMIALVERIIKEERFHDSVCHDVRNASGGRGGVLKELKKYFQNVKKLTGSASSCDLVIVAIDGNCGTYSKMQQNIMKRKDVIKYQGEVICAVPDPHIERWYLIDGHALRIVIGASDFAICPSYKCEKDRYKNAIIDYLSRNDIKPIFGGAEYGEDIIKIVDLEKLQREDGGFNSFINDLRGFLRRHQC